MIAILIGPDASYRAQQWAHARAPNLWFSYDDATIPTGVTVVRDAPFDPLATYAQRVRHPELETGKLIIPNLDYLRHTVPPRRPPALTDFNGSPDLMRICKMKLEGKDPYRSVTLGSGSFLYQQVLARVGRGIPSHEDKIAEFGQAVAAEAMTQLVCDLRDAGKDLCIVAWEIPVGKTMQPYLPKSVHQLAHLEAWCEGRETVRIRKSTWGGIVSGDTIDPGDWSFLDEY